MGFTFMTLAFLAFFVLGSLAGSFLNTVVHRRPRGQSALQGRSRCPYCRKTLRWFELVPFFSFLLQGGRCRRCRKPIGWHYFFGEGLTALVWGVLGTLLVNRGEFLWLVVLLPLVTLLTLLFLYDARRRLLPDVFVLPALLLALVFVAFAPRKLADSFFFPIFNGDPLAPLVGGGLAALGAGLFFLALYLATRGRGLGFGDVKLALVLGVMSGWPGILDTLLIAFCVGAIAGIMYLALGLKTWRSAVPFGPFLIAAQFLVTFYQLYNAP